MRLWDDYFVLRYWFWEKDGYDGCVYIFTLNKMFQKYIEYLLSKAIYEKDDNGYIIVRIPDKEWYYTQWESFEEARENMIDLIETFLLDDMKTGNIGLEDINIFNNKKIVSNA